VVDRALGQGFSPGFRPTPGYHPTPNGEPTGYKTGAPVYTKFFSLQIPPGKATEIVPGTAENRIVTITAPALSFKVFIGTTGVTVNRGLQLPAGLAYQALLPGLQALYAATDAPVVLTLQIQVATILASDQQREVG
jgi:hypothetical protein